MPDVVLIAWIVQAAVGVALLIGWMRHRRSGPAGRAGGVPLLAHVGLVLVALGLWIAFLLTGSAWLAWTTFALLTVALSFGDVLLVRRARRMAGERAPSLRDYGAAISAVFRGRMPGRVTFHALFSPVVYFSCLGVCIGATIAAPG